MSDVLIRLNMGRENAFPGGWVHNDYVRAIAEIERLRHELAEAKEELAQRREHMRRGIEAGRPTGGVG